ncbi:MAG: hypothetical protein ACREB8_16840 [Pseudolabrys sp.]
MIPVYHIAPAPSRSRVAQTVGRLGGPNGDGHAIGTTGKFLPYKYYGATASSGLRKERAKRTKLSTPPTLFSLSPLLFRAPQFRSDSAMWRCRGRPVAFSRP